MLDLGKGISEYEDLETRESIFEEPYNYNRIFEEDFLIISGRKGAGKSTIADYQEAISQNQGTNIIIYRPEYGDELYETISDLIEVDENIRPNRKAIAKLFEFLIYILLMRDAVEGKEEKLLLGDLANAYNFLSNNGLVEGSAIRRSLKFLSEVTTDYKKLNSLFTILSKVSGPSFNEAKRSISRYIKNKKEKTIIFFDDIDSFGFEYNSSTKVFLEALIICCMSINLTWIKEGAPIRLIITPPTEILDNGSFWNRDKIAKKTIFLRWKNIEKIRNLVSKRISAELNIKKRARRYPTDKYSIDPKRSWSKIYPEKVSNRVGTQEDTLDYIARHTFYSPRTVLAICNDILNRLSEDNYTIDTVSQVSDSDWAMYIQNSCEETSVDLSRSFFNVFSQLYDNIEDFVFAFEGRPNIWTKGNFLSFIQENHWESICKKDGGHSPITGERLINLLYTIGFIGLGFHKKSFPVGGRNYETSFSFLKWTQKRKYDLILVAPLFYDELNMQPIRGIVVEPHRDIKVNQESYNMISNYNHRTNSFF